MTPTYQHLAAAAAAGLLLILIAAMQAGDPTGRAGLAVVGAVPVMLAGGIATDTYLRSRKGRL